jgi:hypothetical protein
VQGAAKSASSEASTEAIASVERSPHAANRSESCARPRQPIGAALDLGQLDALTEQRPRPRRAAQHPERVSRPFRPRIFTRR